MMILFQSCGPTMMVSCLYIDPAKLGYLVHGMLSSSLVHAISLLTMPMCENALWNDRDKEYRD